MYKYARIPYLLKELLLTQEGSPSDRKNEPTILPGMSDGGLGGNFIGNLKPS